MLLAHLIEYFRNRKTLQLFLLEIVAVFIGITASLFINDWQQRRTDRARLDQMLQEIYTNVLNEQDYYREEVIRQSRAARSTMQLLSMDLDELTDREVGERFQVVGMEPYMATMPGGYERLLASDLLVDANSMRSELDYAHGGLQIRMDNSGSMFDRVTDTALEILDSAGAVMTTADLGSVAGAGDMLYQRWRDMHRLVQSGMPDEDMTSRNGAAYRRALAEEDFRHLVSTLAVLRYDNAQEAWKMDSWSDDVAGVIRRHAPHIRLPVREIGVDGSATGHGFSALSGPSKTLPMRPVTGVADEWAVTADLVDGTLHIRADNQWDFYWGAPIIDENLVDGMFLDNTVFAGDPASVMPDGTAELKGIAFPISAGRYRITFNSHTFEYSFTALGE